MSTNGNLLLSDDVVLPTPEQQLDRINHELRKIEIKKRGLEEYRRELINRYNLNKANNEAK